MYTINSRSLGSIGDIEEYLDQILIRAVDSKTTDIHIEPYSKFGVIRFRIHGKLEEIYHIKIPTIQAITSRIKLISKLDISESRIPQDGRFYLQLKDNNIEFRVSTFPTIYGEKTVIRVLDKSTFSFKKEALNFDAYDLSRFEKLINRPYGLILVSGPSGSGKTTTLYTILEELKSESKNIVTIEDPVEYTFTGITQSQVDNKNYSFRVGLEAILRQDPDVIMLGEIRDRYVAELSVRAALTGHLVLSTIHTGDGIRAIFRLLSLGVDKNLLAPSLIGIISQRLVRKLCSNCREAYNLSEDEGQSIGLTGGEKIYKPRGCKDCRSGYVGLMPIIEILEIDEYIRKFIVENRSIDYIRDKVTSRVRGNLDYLFLRELLKGNISLDDYRSCITNIDS